MQVVAGVVEAQVVQLVIMFEHTSQIPDDVKYRPNAESQTHDPALTTLAAMHAVHAVGLVQDVQVEGHVMHERPFVAA